MSSSFRNTLHCRIYNLEACKDLPRPTELQSSNLAPIPNVAFGFGKVRNRHSCIRPGATVALIFLEHFNLNLSFNVQPPPSQTYESCHSQTHKCTIAYSDRPNVENLLSEWNANTDSLRTSLTIILLSVIRNLKTKARRRRRTPSQTRFKKV